MGIFSKRLLKKGRSKCATKNISAIFAVICEGVANLL